MLKKIILLINVFMLSNFVYSLDIEGQIYNIIPRGGSYQGSLEAKIYGNRENGPVRFSPMNDIEIVRINGDKDENNIYFLEGNSIKVDFIYKSKTIPKNNLLTIANLEFLNEVSKTETLLGKVNVEFRDKGQLDMKVKGKMDFGLINPIVPKNGISSRENPEITIDLKIDKKDVGNTKLYFEYPKKIEMADGQLEVVFQERSDKASISERGEGNTEVKVITFIPSKSDSKERIELEGRIYSKVKQVKPGDYRATAKIKAYYEYLDFSSEQKKENTKLVIRR